MSFIINSISDYSKWHLTIESDHICRPKSLIGIFKHSIWIFKMPYQYTLVTQNISFKHFLLMYPSLVSEKQDGFDFP